MRPCGTHVVCSNNVPQLLAGAGQIWAGQKRNFNDLLGPGLPMEGPNGMQGLLDDLARLKQQRL